MKLPFILLAGLGLGSGRRPINDAAAIKQVLEKESATWRASYANW